MDLKTYKGKAFWSMPVEEVSKMFNSDLEKGLLDREVKDRLDLYGKNIFQTSRKNINGIKIFFNQLKSPLILVLIFAGLVTIFISDYRDSVFIFIAVIVNSILGYYQEYKAEKALSELSTYLKQRARVIRSGKEKEIDAEEIVMGDIIRLSQGDRISADSRILYSNDLQVDESILTGESLPSMKSAEPVSPVSVLADQASMVFAGTLVTQGICTAIVCRTDKDTEIGKIASLIENSESEKTPLQKSITKFSLQLSLFLGLLTVIVFSVGVFLGEPWTEMFLTSVAIAVSAIPEGLPISMTVILAVGVQKMAKRNAVVKKLIAAEALGSTTLILTDKTGTLTMAKMVLSKVLALNLKEEELLKYALVNCNVSIENPEDQPSLWRVDGKIMEVAIVKSLVERGYGYEEIMNKKNVLQSVPFNPVSKFSVSYIKHGEKHLLVFFGAPDILLSHSELSATEKEKYMSQVDSLALGGERVLGIAIKEVAHTGDLSLSKHVPIAHLLFGGLITFVDPIRPSIKNTIALIKQAGVRTVILTGDHRGTAMAVAREIGMELGEESVMDASELESLSEQELKNRLPKLSVISRVTPFDKMKIARFFQELGEVVAMTGDGVNDAPSLKQANVGIAMGSGTEVAQSVSDLVLLDDNFESIVAAIEEGRQILSNIRKVLVYLLSNVADGLILIGGSLISGLPLPLNALQILWVNFFADSFPAISFAFERDAESFSHKPSKKNYLFDPLMKFLIIAIGLSTSTLLFAIYYYLMKIGYDENLVKTFTFAAFGTYTLMTALSVRSLDKGIFSYSFFSNKYMTVGIGFGFALMALAIYAPVLQVVFDTVYLPLNWAIGVLLVGLLNILLIEVTKYFFNKRVSERS